MVKKNNKKNLWSECSSRLPVFEHNQLTSACVLGGPEPADGPDARYEAGGVRALGARRPLLGG